MQESTIFESETEILYLIEYLNHHKAWVLEPGFKK